EFYRKNLQRFAEWYGDREAKKLEFANAADYIARLRAAGVGNVTSNHHLRSAKAVLNHAVEGNRLLKNPWRKVPLLPEWERKRILTDEEFEKLLKACDACIAYRGAVTREDNAQLMVFSS